MCRYSFHLCRENELINQLQSVIPQVGPGLGNLDVLEEQGGGPAVTGKLLLDKAANVKGKRADLYVPKRDSVSVSGYWKERSGALRVRSCRVQSGVDGFSLEARGYRRSQRGSIQIGLNQTPMANRYSATRARIVQAAVRIQLEATRERWASWSNASAKRRC